MTTAALVTVMLTAPVAADDPVRICLVDVSRLWSLDDSGLPAPSGVVDR